MSRHILIFTVLLLLGTPAAYLHAADEVPHARAYLDALEASLDQIQNNMPDISKAADTAALALADGAGFGVRGDDGLASELSNRAGAMMGYDGRRGKAGDVILYVFGLGVSDDLNTNEQLEQQLNIAAELKADGSTLIGLGSTARLRQFGLLDRADTICDAWLDNAADIRDGKLNAPNETVNNAVLAWTFECELFAALTRVDKVPTVQQSFEIDTLKKRWYRYGIQHFHHDRWLDPIDPGRLGGTYITKLHAVLLDIGTSSWPQIVRTVNRAYDTKKSGGTVWLRAGGRYLPYHLGGKLNNDQELFTLLTHDGSNPNLPAPGMNDFVIAVGEHETAGSWEWGEPELLRKAGRGVTWIVNGYNTQDADLKRREVLIDLWAPVGDTAIKVDDYDVKLGPISGITGEAVTWMIAAELAGRMQSSN